MGIYKLEKNNQFGFEPEEIEADPVLKLAAENAPTFATGTIECSADSPKEAFEIFFGCDFDNPPEFLPDFFEIGKVWYTDRFPKYIISE